MAKSFVLFDCDTGSDDAVAFMMLLSQKDKVKIVGVTCVQGNTELDNVVMNNLRILKLYDRLADIPLFRGCSTPLVPLHKVFPASHIHGLDGLGDQPDFHPAASSELLRYVKEEHAANAIVRLSKEYSGKLKVVATGPLTNLALAIKLDPELPSRLSGVYIMGGTRFALGNSSPAAEYNFYYDPESAYLTIQCYSRQCTVHVVNYEYTCDNALSWEKYKEWLSHCSKKSSFAQMVLGPLERWSLASKETPVMNICDAYTMAIALDSSIGKSPENVRICVELGGHHSRGHVVVDHRNKDDSFASVVMYNSIDIDKYFNLLMEAVK